MIARHIGGAGLVALALATSARADDNKDTPSPWTLQRAIGDPDDLKVTGSIRLRYEGLHNQFRPGFDRDDDLVEAQIAIAAEWTPGPLRLGAEMVDARAYSSDAGSSVGTGEVNTFELLQAYVGADLGDALGAGTRTTIDAGRFVLDLGSRRLVARSNFANSPNGFAGARFDLTTSDKSALTLFYTRPTQKLPSDKASILDNRFEWDRNGKDLTFWGGFFSRPKFFAGGGVETYFLALDERDRPTRATRDRHLFTPGARIFRDPAAGSFDYELEYAYQFGSISASTSASATRLPVAAHYLHAEIGYQATGAWKPRISFEYDLATGNGRGRSYGRFDGLFGSRRADYGPTGIYGPLGRSNLSSPGVRIEVAPSKRLDAMAFWRLAWLDKATDSFASTGVADTTGNSGKCAGQQVEARARYWLIPKAIRIELGAAALIRGRFLKEAPNGSRNGDTLYGFGDLTFSF